MLFFFERTFRYDAIFAFVDYLNLLNLNLLKVFYFRIKRWRMRWCYKYHHRAISKITTTESCPTAELLARVWMKVMGMLRAIVSDGGTAGNKYGKCYKRNSMDNGGIKVERMGVPYRMWSRCSGRDHRVPSSPPVSYKESSANILKQITSPGRSPL